MKRKLIAALCITGALLFAGSAMAADHEVVGFMSTRAIVNNYGSGTTPAKSDDSSSFAWVEQRFRGKWSINVNEYVSVVYYGEIDMEWGDAAFSGWNGPATSGTAPSGRNNGGGPQGDTVNLETKNLYMAIKVPDTPVSFKAGLQGYNAGLNGLLLVSDVAGVTFAGNYGGANLGLVWFKFWEGSTGSVDDADMYGITAAMSPADNAKLRASFYFAKDKGENNAGERERLPGISDQWDEAELYWLTLDGSYKMDALSITGILGYNFGTIDFDATTEGDVAGVALDVKVAYALPEVTLGLEGWYVTGDDDDTDDDVDTWLSTSVFSGAPNRSLGTDLPLYKSGLMVIGTDPYSANMLTSTLVDHYQAGLGMIGGVLTANYKPAAMEKMYVKAAVGYQMAAEDNAAGDSSIGTELNARVGYKMADNFDLSCNAAYVMLGDFYDDPAGDPDDLWIAYLMARATF